MMANIRGSYQTSTCDSNYISVAEHNGYPEQTRPTSHIVNMMEPNMTTRADLLEFGQTLRSKMRGLVSHNGSRPDIIGGMMLYSGP